MQIIALSLGRIVYLILRLTGRKGSALPGYVVEKVFPNFMARALNTLSGGVVIITGTNGKTTATKMLTHVLRSKYRVLTNPTGSNFVRGITSTIIHNSSVTGGLPYDTAVFELDEAHAALFVKAFSPRAVMVTNVMRDQMDRFGEIDHTAKLIEKVVAKATDFVVLNKDDPRVLKMKDANCQATIGYFGVADSLRSVYLTDDELHDGKAELATQVVGPVIAELQGFDKSGKTAVRFGKKVYEIQLKTPGSFNVQNAVAACAAAVMFGIAVEVITTKIAEVKPAFGRGEELIVDNKRIALQLVKNPNGFRHALISHAGIAYDASMIAINDNYADGRDVSWLWDVSFTDSIKQPEEVYTSGTRAVDMALRLKYDGITATLVEPSLEKCLYEALAKVSEGGRLVIYSTYTAMLHLRKIISGSGLDIS
jgi:lipid II isoglutaminyl synthase (glutamine-hydrolysing)